MVIFTSLSKYIALDAKCNIFLKEKWILKARKLKCPKKKRKKRKKGAAPFSSTTQTWNRKEWFESRLWSTGGRVSYPALSTERRTAAWTWCSPSSTRAPSLWWPPPGKRRWAFPRWSLASWWRGGWWCRSAETRSPPRNTSWWWHTSQCCRTGDHNINVSACGGQTVWLPDWLTHHNRKHRDLLPLCYFY